jgi:fibronectin type 3 domain-containing protein
VGIVPEIGRNSTGDGSNVIFSLDDAQAVETFAQQNGIGSIAIWSINRDQPSAAVGSPHGETDSSLAQDPYAFSQIFSQFAAGGQVNGNNAAPSTPTQVTATASGQTIQVNWSAVAGADSYNVYRGTVSGQEQLLVNVATASFSDPNLPADGTTYYYTVTAVNANGESAQSSEVSATPVAAPGAPAAPVGPTATPSDSTVSLSWSAVAGADSYNVYRSTASGQEQWVANVTTNSFVDTGLTNGTTYFYTVTAGTGNLESGFSTEVSAAPGAPAAPVDPITTPAAPVDLTATPSDSTVSLSWSAVAGADSYNVYRSTASGQEQWVTNVTDPSYVDTDVAGGTIYYYTVTAGNGDLESGFSNEASATIPIRGGFDLVQNRGA